MNLRVILPGVSEKDVNVSVQNNQLVIAGGPKRTRGFSGECLHATRLRGVLHRVDAFQGSRCRSRPLPVARRPLNRRERRDRAPLHRLTHRASEASGGYSPTSPRGSLQSEFRFHHGRQRRSRRTRTAIVRIPSVTAGGVRLRRAKSLKGLLFNLLTILRIIDYVSRVTTRQTAMPLATRIRAAHWPKTAGFSKRVLQRLLPDRN